jgi:uridine kinase
VNPDDYDFDHPNSLDMDAAYECIKRLKEKKPAQIPFYSFTEHRRIPGKESIIQPANIVIIEGILIFYDQVRNTI